MIDISEACLANSKQIDACDLGPDPVLVYLMRVEPIGNAAVANDKRKWKIALEGWEKPWIPCKTMIRLLRELWGSDASLWIGHTVELYNDPSVSFGKAKTGGIRISGADIDRPAKITLMISQGAYREYEVRSIPPLPSKTLEEVLTAAGLALADIDADRAKRGKEALKPEQLQDMADFYRRNPSKLPKRTT